MTEPTYTPDTALSPAEFAEVERFGLDNPGFPDVDGFGACGVLGCEDCK